MKELTDAQKAQRLAYNREWQRQHPEQVKEYSRRSRAKNKDKIRARQAIWREANKERHAERARAWYAENRTHVADRNMQKSYGISLADYAALLEEQQGSCAICGSTTPGKGERFAVDHNHSCCPGATSCGLCIRGLLCVHCNVGLGHFRDNELLLHSAILYLANDKKPVSDRRSNE